MWEWRYNSTHSQPRHYMKVNSKLQVPSALSPRKDARKVLKGRLERKVTSLEHEKLKPIFIISTAYKATCSPKFVLSRFQKWSVLPAGQSEAPAATLWAFTGCRLREHARTTTTQVFIYPWHHLHETQKHKCPTSGREKPVFYICRWVETLSKSPPEVSCDSGLSRRTFNKTD